jgi:hypothetical protein
MNCSDCGIGEVDCHEFGLDLVCMAWSDFNHALLALKASTPNIACRGFEITSAAQNGYQFLLS